MVTITKLPLSIRPQQVSFFVCRCTLYVDYFIHVRVFLYCMCSCIVFSVGSHLFCPKNDFYTRKLLLITLFHIFLCCLCTWLPYCCSYLLLLNWLGLYFISLLFSHAYLCFLISTPLHCKSFSYLFSGYQVGILDVEIYCSF